MDNIIYMMFQFMFILACGVYFFGISTFFVMLSDFACKMIAGNDFIKYYELQDRINSTESIYYGFSVSLGLLCGIYWSITGVKIW